MVYNTFSKYWKNPLHGNILLRFKEVDCDTCKSITRLIAGLMTMEDTRVSLVEYLASDFCINGVPAGDVEFCDVSTDDIYIDYTCPCVFYCRDT